MRTVNKIEAKVPQIPSRKKVAAYARVSIESERLQHSLSAQVSYYSALIQKHPDWEYAGVYADEGISGTGTAKRDEFNRLLEDCEAGKIDIVLTKSISRFARNTVDLLNTVRRLKELGISVQFEKEHIDSLTEDGELMLTLLASFAQEESRSISENVKWGTVKRFKEGIPNGKFRIYGYEWQGEELVIVPEEAAVVRRIFQNFLDGKSRLETERELAAEGITTKNGCRWGDSNIAYVLRNCTYTGDLLLHKEYISDPINKKRRKNRGELPQYLVTDHHEPIIDKDTFDFVQAEMARRKELGPFGNKALNTCCFTGKIKCPYCGYSYMHNVHNSRNQDSWICGSKKKKKSDHPCPVKGVISNKVLKSVCAEVLGLLEFDEAVFLEKVDHIEVPLQETLDFYMKDGTTIRREAKSTGHQDCWTPERRAAKGRWVREQQIGPNSTCFTSRIRCELCGAYYRRQAPKPQVHKPYAIWRCASTGNCESTSIHEDTLKSLAAEAMGIPEFQDELFREQIAYIGIVDKGRLVFHFKDGHTSEASWVNKRRMPKQTPERRAHMSKTMKEIWRRRHGEIGNNDSGDDQPIHGGAD